MHSHDEEVSPATAPRITLHWHTPKTVLVGRLGRDQPQPGELLIPCLKLRGMWLCDAGIAAGTRLKVEVYDGAILLRVPDPAVSVALRPLKRRRYRLQSLR
ncbi:hypothetical protein [Stenotrophomonas sp. PD6]|jgi:toxic protein SymE|uniref:hypothetical protein n=1 Tax=Stenotrophomonas sp. PD6 TaxID=3368612 RepID=UPI003B9E7932